MKPSWLIGIITLWLTTVIVALILDAEYVGAGETSTLYALMHPSFLAGSDIPIVGFFVIVWNYIKILFDILLYDYPFLTGSWEVLKYFGWILSIGTIISIIFAIRGTSSG